MTLIFKTRVFCLALITLSASALSHETWLAGPASGISPVGATITLDLTSGMKFPTLDYAIKSERIERALCRIQGKTMPISERQRGTHALRLSVPFTSPGCATAWVQLKPRSLQLTPAKVEEYFQEINAPATVRRKWAMSPAPRHWRETYTKCAKTFVQVGAAEDRSWRQPVGLALEIVPDKNPNLLHSGEELPVQILKQGKPLAYFSLGLRRQGDAKSVFHQTDSKGRTAFRLSPLRQMDAVWNRTCADEPAELGLEKLVYHAHVYCPFPLRHSDKGDMQPHETTRLTLPHRECVHAFPCGRCGECTGG